MFVNVKMVDKSNFLNGTKSNIVNYKFADNAQKKLQSES